MSLQNFSNAKSQNTVTFKELNFLIDQWISDIQDNLNVFSLQSDEINKLTLDICNSRQMLVVLYQRLNFATCLQENLDQTLNHICNDQAGVQQLVNKVEKETPLTYDKKGSVDVFRYNTYKIAEDLDSTFSNFKEVLDELQIHTGHVNIQHYGRGYVEQIAQLLQAQLGQLEMIEMRVHEIKNLLDQTEHYKQRVLASLHLKENKM